MPIWIVFFLLYLGLARIWSGGYYRWRRLLREYATRSGGNVYRGYRRRFFYVTPQNDLEIEVRRSLTSVLSIRIRKSFPFSVSFQRLPRLVYAFLEAFIPLSYRMERKPYVVVCNPDALSDLRKRAGFEAIFERLSKAGFSVKVGPKGMKLWKVISRTDSGEHVVEDYLRLAREFAQVCSGALVEIPVHAIPSEQHCAFCKELLTESAAVTKCVICGTPQHSECFELNGKCSVFGCESPTRTPELVRVS